MPERPTRAERGANRSQLFFALGRADLGSPPSPTIAGMGVPQRLEKGLAVAILREDINSVVTAIQRVLD